MRAIYLALIGVSLVAGTSNLRAAQIAFDSAGDSAYNSFNNLVTPYPDGGYGWGGPWQGALRLGSSSSNGFGDPQSTGDINSPRTPLGRAWELSYVPDPDWRATNTISRPFSGSLAPGQTFSLDLDTGDVAPINPSSQQIQGFVLGQSTSIFQSFLETGIKFAADPMDGYSDYVVANDVGKFDTGIPLTDRGIHVAVKVVDASTVQVSATSLAPGGGSTSLVLPYSVPLATVTIINDEIGPDPDNPNLFFNNVAITPEPASAIFLVISVAVAALGRGRQTRYRRS